jgi:pyruvate carboxylase
LPLRPRCKLNGHALQCRVTTEDPLNNFIPDYGRITAYREATGNGIRLDGGTAYSGAVITRYYDSLLVKVTAWAQTPEKAIARMDRALREFRIRGVATNIEFVDQPAEAPDLPERHLHDQVHRHDARAVRIQEAPRPGDEDPDLHRRHHGERPPRNRRPPQTPGRGAQAPKPPPANAPLPGTRNLLEKGPQAVADWMASQKKVLLTDTTMRDGHQSLLATRMRSIDMIKVAPGLCRQPAAALSASNAGAAPPSTWPTASCRNAPGSACATCAPHAEPDDADAAARLERRGLHELSRQRRAGLRQTGRRRPASTCSACSTA